MEAVDRKNSRYKVPIPPYAREYHVLIIEEDPISSTRIASILREASYQVTEIQIPEVALCRIQAQPKLFDLALLGTPLKGMDCIKFLEDILAVNEDMAVIFMASKHVFNQALTAITSGASLVLEKPIRKYDFLSLWQHVFRKRSLAEKKKEGENALTTINLNHASLHDCDKCKGKGKDIMMDEVNQSPVVAKMKKPMKLEVKAEASKTKIALRKRKERDDVRDDQKKHKPTWNPELHKKFMDVLTKDYADGAGNGVAARKTSQATHSPNLRGHLVASLAQRHRLKAAQLSAASQNFTVRGAPRGSTLQFRTGSTKIQEPSRTRAPQTSHGAADWFTLNLHERAMQIINAYNAQQNQHPNQEVNSIFRPLTSAVRKPYALTGSDSAAGLLRMSMGGNMARSPRVNFLGRTPPMIVSLIAGQNPRPNATQCLDLADPHPNATQGLNHDVNVREDEDEDSEIDDGIDLEELLPEVKKEDDAHKSCSTSKDRNK